MHIHYLPTTVSHYVAVLCCIFVPCDFAAAAALRVTGGEHPRPTVEVGPQNESLFSLSWNASAWDSYLLESGVPRIQFNITLAGEDGGFNPSNGVPPQRVQVSSRLNAMVSAVAKSGSDEKLGDPVVVKATVRFTASENVGSTAANFQTVTTHATFADKQLFAGSVSGGWESGQSFGTKVFQAERLYATEIGRDFGAEFRFDIDATSRTFYGIPEIGPRGDMSYSIEILNVKCDVPPIPPGEPAEIQFKYEDLDPLLSERLIKLRDLVGVNQFNPRSGRRSEERQAHLYKIAETYQVLKGHGMVDGIPFGNFSQLSLPQDPSPELLACTKLMEDVNNEIKTHEIKDPTPGKGVADPKTSKHVKGLAADVTISGPPDDEITHLAHSVGLWRPLWEKFGNEKEKHHFEVWTKAPFRTTAVIRGESPINLLVEDSFGRRIGFDPVSGEEVNEIGFSSYYSGAGSEPQIIVVPSYEISLAEYRVTGVGTGDGPYTLRRQLVDDDDPTNILSDSVIATGVATMGTLLPVVQVRLVVPEPTAAILALVALPSLLKCNRPQKRCQECSVEKPKISLYASVALVRRRVREHDEQVAEAGVGGGLGCWSASVPRLFASLQSSEVHPTAVVCELGA